MPKPYPAAAEPTIDQEAALIEAKAAAQAEADRLAAAAVAQEESERLAALADAQAAKAAPKRRVRKERPPQSIPFFVAEDSEENGALLWVAVRAGPTFLLVGDATGSHPEFAPIATTANDWELRSGQLVFTGNAVLFGQGLAAARALRAGRAAARQAGGAGDVRRAWQRRAARGRNARVWAGIADFRVRRGRGPCPGQMRS